MIGTLALALVVASSVVEAPAVGDATPSDRAATQRLIIRCSAVEFESLRAELATRWPGAQVLPYGGEAFEQLTGVPFTYLEVIGEPVGDAPVAVTVVLSDGRAYLRRVVLSDAARARVLAVALANLLGAIEDEDVPPDRVNVVVPIPVDVPEPIAEVPTEPVEPAIEPDGPVAEPVGPVPEPTPSPTLDKTITTPRDRRNWRLGLRGDLALLFGLGQRRRGERPTLGGELGLDARAPNGLALGVGVRVTGRSALDFRLVRTRIAPWLGYVARVRRLELAVGFGPTLEPWRLSRGGEGLTLESRDGAGWTILYGAALHGGLGWWTPLGPRRSSSLRLGLDLDLAASAQASGKSVLVRTAPRGRELFALGGVEVAVALEAVWWFELRPRRANRAAGAAAAK